MRGLGARLFGWATALVACFMVAPLAVLLLFCFNDGPLLSFPIEHFSARWFGVVFNDPEFLVALANSLVITLAVGIASTVTGTLAGLILPQLKVRHALSLTAFLGLPLMLPPLMLGVMLLSFFSMLDLRLGLGTVILGHLVFTQPLVVSIVAARMTGFDVAVIDSARDLGASRAYAFFTVTLPVIRANVIGAALIAMALSLDDFLVTLFTIGGGSTLPIFLWGMLRKGVDPSINVIAATVMLLSITGSIIGLRVTRYRG